MSVNKFLYLLQIKFEFCVTKYSYSAEKFNKIKVLLQLLTFITFGTINVGTSTRKIASYLELQERRSFILQAPHFGSEFGPNVSQTSAYKPGLTYNPEVSL